MKHIDYQHNQLHVEKVSVAEIAEKFGTPCYIYSRAAIEREAGPTEHSLDVAQKRLKIAGDKHQRGNQNRSNDALRSQLLDAAQLAPKGKSSIYAQDVQIIGPGGIDGMRFLFPRNNPISANDKEVDFILNIRRIKVEEKFKLGDMQYEGQLAL